MKNDRITIYDIARQLNLSPATISRVLNHPDQVSYKTRQKVLLAMQKAEYSKRKYGDAGQGIRHTSGSKAGRNQYLLNIPTPRNPFYEEIIEGINSAASQHGCHVFTDYTSLSEQTIGSFLSMLKTYDFSGIIICGASSESMLQQLQDSLPVVECSEYNETFSNISYVSIDDIQAEEKATNYILSLGCRKIAFVSSTVQYRYAYRRLQGFLTAIKNAGVTAPDRWILQIPQVNFSIAYDAVYKLLSQPEYPEAILCASDVYAAACIKAAHDLKISIPDQLYVIGFDNISMAISSSPSITTVDQPRFQLGYNAFEILYAEVTQPMRKKQHLLLPTDLILRESTAGIQKR